LQKKSSQPSTFNTPLRGNGAGLKKTKIMPLPDRQKVWRSCQFV